jgi:type I restriction enzyme S subunit
MSVLGLVPADWNYHTLGELLEERVEVSSDTTRYSLFSLTIEEGLVPKSERYERSFLLKDKENNQYRLVYPGDYVYNPMNLRFGAITQSNLERPVLVSAYYNVLSLRSSKADPSFLGKLLSSPKLLRHYDTIAIGSLNEKKRVHLREFLKVVVPLPALDEQRKIAEIFSCWEEAIQVLEYLVASYEKEFQYKLQLILNSIDGKPGTIQDLGEVESGGTPDTSKEEYWEGEIPWCTPTDITALESRYINDTPRKITQAGLSASSAKLLPCRSIIVCTRATVGEAAINAIPVTTNQGFKSIIPKSNINSEYVYYLIRFLKPLLLKLSSGSTFLEISKTDFCKVPIVIPSPENQAKVASYLSSADDHINALTRQVFLFKRQKQSLMQKLLTGKTRVKV